jgi:hypothetical protein
MNSISCRYVLAPRLVGVHRMEAGTALPVLFEYVIV